jgi:hypothetical protein
MSAHHRILCVVLPPPRVASYFCVGLRSLGTVRVGQEFANSYSVAAGVSELYNMVRKRFLTGAPGNDVIDGAVVQMSVNVR